MWYGYYLMPWVMVPLSMGQEIYNSVYGGSYNSFLGQVGFCKAQSFGTRSRSTSQSAPLFQSGRVWMGVGLSHVQFQGSVVSCGRCAEVLSVDRFYHFNEELTDWDYDETSDGNFTVIVFDECTDPICGSGFLDFDIYNERQPVAHGNPTNLTWRFVPCPVGEGDTIGFLFCLGYDSCQEHHREGRKVADLYHDAVQDNWFTLYPRNFRTAITAVAVQGEPLQDAQAWVWKSHKNTLLRERVWQIQWTNEDGSQQSWDLDWGDHLLETSTPDYRGGHLIGTDQQN